MKTLLDYRMALVALVLNIGFHTLAGPPPGQVDFGTFAPPGDSSQFVEVQINSNLLSLAARAIEKQQPDAARLLRGVQLVRVNVIGLTDENRAEMQKRVRQIRHELDTEGWEHNVVVQDKGGQEVGVYTKTRGSEALAGLAITVIDPKDSVVLINIVGDIRPEQVVILGEKLDIKPLKDIGAALNDAASKELPVKEPDGQK